MKSQDNIAKRKSSRQAFIAVFALLLLCAAACIAGGGALSARADGEAVGGFAAGAHTAVTAETDGTRITGDGETAFSAVKTDVGYGINGAEVSFDLTAAADYDGAFALMLSADKQAYDTNGAKSFGLYFTDSGSKVALAVGDGNDVTLSEAIDVTLNKNGSNTVKFDVEERFNRNDFAGYWRAYVNDTQLNLDVTDAIHSVQRYFTDGYGYVNFAYTGTKAVSAVFKAAESVQKGFKQVDTEIAGGASVWTPGGNSRPIKGAYNRGGYFELMSDVYAEWDVYKSDRTYTIGGIEIAFDIYAAPDASADLRLSFSTGKEWTKGPAFFFGKGKDAQSASMQYWGGNKVVGSVSNAIPFNWDGTNVLKVYQRESDGKWEVDINGFTCLSDCTSILDGDINGKYTNQQANIYIWDADAVTTNRFAIRYIDTQPFAGEIEGWEKLTDDTVFEISNTGKVLVTGKSDSFAVLKSDSSYNVTKFTHKFRVEKDNDDKNPINIVLSNQEALYSDGGAAVIISAQFKEAINASNNFYTIKVSTYSDGKLTELGSADVVNYYRGAVNKLAFGKTFNGWVLRINDKAVTFAQDISTGLDGVLPKFTDNKCWLQIESKNAAGTYYEFDSAKTELTTLEYSKNWAPGKAGGSAFAEPTVKGQETMLPPENTDSYSNIKIDRKVPLDGFALTFDMHRPAGDLGKHFGVIIGSSTEWYSDSQAVLFMFRPVDDASTTPDKATLCFAYADKTANKDLWGDIAIPSSNPTQITVPFNWMGENTVKLNKVGGKWVIEINGITALDDVDDIAELLGVNEKIAAVESKYEEGSGYLQVWNGGAYTEFTVKELTEIIPPKTLPLIIGSFNFSGAIEGTALTIDLTKLFRADEDVTLVYTAEKGTIDGTTWTYTAPAAGTTEFITITATDADDTDLAADYVVIVDTRKESQTNPPDPDNPDNPDNPGGNTGDNTGDNQGGNNENNGNGGNSQVEVGKKKCGGCDSSFGGVCGAAGIIVLLAAAVALCLRRKKSA